MRNVLVTAGSDRLRHRDTRLGLALAGCFAGIVATVPMTTAMVRIHRRLPRRQRYALPPRIITDGVAARLPVPDRMLPEAGPGRALAAHFAFGAATGGLYGAATAQMRIKPGLTSGIAYGLGVWAASYLGWVPAAGLMPHATKQPAQRNLMMIAAHIVWGAALGAVTAATAPSEDTGRH
jgi:uncharacterized membrane protein YagU involved in acid resistance